jgi:DNA processing protein
MGEVQRSFLIRNRVIAAATRGTVVVEASARSGASQTLRRAIALGRRPMVVPGPVTRGSGVLRREKAGLSRLASTQPTRDT